MPAPIRRLAVLLLSLLVACGGAEQPPVPTCATPRDAVDSVLAWQHPGSWDLDHAARCLEAEGEQALRRARQIKQILDARGLYVHVDAFPDEPDATNEDGKARFPVAPPLPLYVAQGDDGLWRYTEASLDQIPRLYRETFSPLATAIQHQLPPVFFRQVGGVTLWQVSFAAVLVLLSFLAGLLVERVLYSRVVRLARRLDLPVGRADTSGLSTPIQLAAVFAVLTWGAPQLQLPIHLSVWVVGGVDVGLRLALIWLAFGLVDVFAHLGSRWASKTDSKLDDQLIPLLRSTANTVIIALGFLVIMGALGVDVWKLLAGASVGGLIVGLAAQDSVKNFFGSLNVFIDRPFQIGDWVVIGSVEGVVEEVGFRSTRIRTFHNSQVTVPNSTITNANVDNMGRRPRRRVKLTLGLTYDTPPDLLQAYVEGVRAILAAHPGVQKSYEVHVHGLGASSIDILVYYHLVVADWHEELTTRAANILEFLRLAEDLGVSFAFPSTSLYVEATPDQPLAERPVGAIEELAALVRAFGPGGEKAQPDGPPFPHDFDAPNVQAKGS